MESRPNALLAYTGLLAAAAKKLNNAMPGPSGLLPAGSTATKPEKEALTWVTSLSGSSAGRWFFAQAPDPENEDQEEPEDEDEANAEPQRRNDPTVRKPSASEDNAEQLRDGGTINPPFP